MRCPSCGSNKVDEDMVTGPLEYGVEEKAVISVTQPVMACRQCDEQWTDYRGEQACEEAVARCIRVFGKVYVHMLERGMKP